MINKSNKKIIPILARRSILQNKMNNFFIIITIALSSGLLMLSGLYQTGKTVIEQRRLSTAQHVIYHNVNEEQIKGLNSDPRVEDMTLIKMGPAVEIDDYMLWSVYYGDTSKTIYTAQIGEGRMPQSFHEVAVNKEYLEKLQLEPKLNTPITVTFLDKSTETFIVRGH